MFPGFAHQAVHIAVERFDYAAIARVEMAVEHVLHPIGGVENTGHYAAPRTVERAEEHGFALTLDHVGLLEKRIVIDGTFVERPGILSHAQRRE